ncbi:PilT protein domain protein [Ferroglobus placidus DSM 10642]|uniref:PilT protein domain protein n=1 Tax=Ferroglobus placidus (strain DSM 10642 / AEDII12DO) TaxID=589924 RepID=D3RYI9_FERPA|nr:PIN domain-containing protein [Ferroglobus placidus]ADC65552.1 PilT protein domain protein [Ferroglobus placidus DSM 10642]
MIYADTDFFLALLKEKDWLKERAKRLLKEYEGQITTSAITFIELALIAKRYGLDVVRIFTSVMTLCGIDDERLLKAAIFIRDYGLGVFDAFHAAYCGGKIISSDSSYDKVGIERIKLEEV